jgi:phosphosulfolactate synthase
MIKLDHMPERTSKPRASGLTHVIDKGLGTNAAKDLVEVAGEYIDIIKFGWGTGVISPNLAQKVEIYKKANIEVCFGGTLFEYFFRYDRVDEYEALVQEFGMDIVEISDGSISMELEDKTRFISRFAEGYKVLSEVGSKDANTIAAPYKWVEEIRATLDVGAYKIVTEGRESGTAGVFRATGEIRSGLIEEILQNWSHEHFIFEAPIKAQQVWFVQQFGSNVNLGNVACDEVIACETLRLGLRGDTLLDFHK